MKTKTHFARVDIGTTPATALLSMSLAWTTSKWQRRPTGQPWRAGQRARITLRQGIRVVMIPGNTSAFQIAYDSADFCR
jgi:hypothetical protein